MTKPSYVNLRGWPREGREVRMETGGPAEVLRLLDAARYPHVDIHVERDGVLLSFHHDFSLLSFCETNNVSPATLTVWLRAFKEGADSVTWTPAGRPDLRVKITLRRNI